MGLKVVFMGTPRFACPSLESLLESEEVLAVVTQPDRPKGRGRGMVSSPVKEIAIHHGLPIFQPESMRDPFFLNDLRRLAPEVIVVVAFGQILPPVVLSIPKRGCLNLHASLLPKYRGAAPVQRAILHGEEVTGVSIIQMDEGMDTGAILAAEPVPIDSEETAGELQDRLSRIGARCLIRTLREVESGRAVARPQDPSCATYAPRLTKEEGRIDWRRPAQEIRNQVRGMNPWPGAFTTLDGKNLRIFRSETGPGGPEGVPGTVLEAREGILRVQTGQGTLLLKEVQIEGRRRMGTADFLRGYVLPEGKVLGMNRFQTREGHSMV